VRKIERALKNEEYSLAGFGGVDNGLKIRTGRMLQFFSDRQLRIS